jgi:putative exporter of polyketide antibiotics
MGRSVMGLNPITEVDVFVATHGWWPWLLTLFILILITCVIAYFVKRRRAAA